MSNSAASPSHKESECRCLCGALMARLTLEGIELKCKRCRRLLTIPFSRINGWALQPHRN